MIVVSSTLPCVFGRKLCFGWKLCLGRSNVLGGSYVWVEVMFGWKCYNKAFDCCWLALVCADTGMTAPVQPKKPAMPNWLRAELIRRGLAPDGPAGKLDAALDLGTRPPPRAGLGFGQLGCRPGTCCALGVGVVVTLGAVYSLGTVTRSDVVRHLCLS